MSSQAALNDSFALGSWGSGSPRHGEPKETAMATINGFFNRGVTIEDTKGKTDQVLRGVGNQVTYQGDHGRNSFHVGGLCNDVDIRNIGRDDTVHLEGNQEDWVITGHSDQDRDDGVLTVYNKRTGNQVRVATDAGRNDDFVRERIKFTGSYSQPPLGNLFLAASLVRGGWGNIGFLGLNPALFSPSSSLRDLAMFTMGRLFGRAEAGMDGPHACRCHYPVWAHPWQVRDPWWG